MNGNEIVNTGVRALELPVGGVLANLAEKLDGRQLLAALEGLCLTWLLTYSIGCVAGYDVTVDRQGFSSKKSA